MPLASVAALVAQTIQFSGLFNDSKTFVDKPLTQDPKKVFEDFYAMTDFSQKRSFRDQRSARIISCDALVYTSVDV
jgi:hypothetical protein